MCYECVAVSKAATNQIVEVIQWSECQNHIDYLVWLAGVRTVTKVVRATTCFDSGDETIVRADACLGGEERGGTASVVQLNPRARTHGRENHQALPRTRDSSP